MMFLKKLVPTVVVGCIMFSTLSFSASAYSAMVQETGNAFNKSFTSSVPIREYNTNFPIGYLIYGFEKKTLSADKDFATCTCEHDYTHYSVLVTGIGSSAGPKYYSSKNLSTHGNATVSASHKGPTVSYGGTINVT